jgi:hypothetical protein
MHMSDASTERTGGCLCGAVRYRTQGEPAWVAHCHCTSCRRTAGAAFVTYAGFKRPFFAYVKGTPKVFESSPGVERSFCPSCGTPLTYEGARWPDEVHIFVCTLDEPQSLAPQAHVYMAETMPWVHLDDNLPRFPTTVSAGKSGA